MNDSSRIELPGAEAQEHHFRLAREALFGDPDWRSGTHEENDPFLISVPALARAFAAALARPDATLGAVPADTMNHIADCLVQYENARDKWFEGPILHAARKAFLNEIRQRVAHPVPAEPEAALAAAPKPTPVDTAVDLGEIERLTDERNLWRERAAERDAECDKRFRLQYDAIERAEKAEAELTAIRKATTPHPAARSDATAGDMLWQRLEKYRVALFEPHRSGDGFRFGDEGKLVLITLTNAEARALLKTCSTKPSDATAGVREAALWAEIARLTPYVEAFRREERRADLLGEELDDLRTLKPTPSVQAQASSDPAAAPRSGEVGTARCDHDWVCADNEDVANAALCLKCHSIMRRDWLEQAGVKVRGAPPTPHLAFDTQDGAPAASAGCRDETGGAASVGQNKGERHG